MFDWTLYRSFKSTIPLDRARSPQICVAVAVRCIFSQLEKRQIKEEQRREEKEKKGGVGHVLH